MKAREVPQPIGGDIQSLKSKTNSLSQHNDSDYIACSNEILMHRNYGPCIFMVFSDFRALATCDSINHPMFLSCLCEEHVTMRKRVSR